MTSVCPSIWPSVLLVEDHPFQLIGLAMQLNRLGFFWIRTALDGAEAIAIIKEGRTFDLLVCDQYLPDSLGLDLIGAIYRMGAARYAILISGVGHQSLLDNMQRVAHQRGLPLLACLSKPLSSEAFLNTLKPLWPHCLTPTHP
ncbi:response regulator [Pseudomonas sp. NPDC087346]|uniref:response regulator n=1 Tax=Pseudomonas sp. NPDC087346 TaxID=3364438 RepID=UPI00382EDBF3